MCLPLGKHKIKGILDFGIMDKDVLSIYDQLGLTKYIFIHNSKVQYNVYFMFA